MSFLGSCQGSDRQRQAADGGTVGRGVVNHVAYQRLRWPGRERSIEARNCVIMEGVTSPSSPPSWPRMMLTTAATPDYEERRDRTVSILVWPFTPKAASSHQSGG